MTERNPIPAIATLVAIDISKYRHEVLIEAAGHQRRRRLTIVSNKADYDRLIETLAAYGDPVLIGFEATEAITTAGWPTACSQQVSNCGWSHRWRSPGRGRLCTTAGTRTIPRTRR